MDSIFVVQDSYRFLHVVLAADKALHEHLKLRIVPKNDIDRYEAATFDPIKKNPTTAIPASNLNYEAPTYFRTNTTNQSKHCKKARSSPKFG